MFRVLIAAIVVGCMVTVWGVQETLVGAGTGRNPAYAELSALEDGEVAPSKYLTIGEHLALYPHLIFQYESEEEFGPMERPPASAAVTLSYYPIISYDHPFIQRLAALVEEYGEFENIPDDAPFPEVEDFRLLVRTGRFKTYREIPADIQEEPDITGLVINRISTLGEEEQELLRESFPIIDLTNILILEDGRAPVSSLRRFGLILGGPAIAVGALTMLVARARGRADDISGEEAEEP